MIYTSRDHVARRVYCMETLVGWVEVTDGLLPDTARVTFAVAPTEQSTIMPAKDNVDFLDAGTVREP
jgi:hypothetical protein